MSVLFLDAPETKALKSARNYLYAAIFCAFFGAVYERFGHGVYSYFMLYAFAFPLTLGALPAILYGLRGAAPRVSRKLWGAGVATLTVGSLFRGVLDIYGTSSALTRVYWVAGVGLLLTAAFLRTDNSGA